MHSSTYFSPESTRTKVVNAYKAGLSATQVHQQFGVSRSMVYRWLKRDGVSTRSSRPRRQPRKTPETVEQQVKALRMTTGYGPLRLAQQLGMPASTVYRILVRLGINKLAPAATLPPARRYEHAQPGALLHVDVKKLHRLSLTTRPRESDCVHVVIDDCTRVVYAERLPDETGPTAADCLERAVAWFESLGVRAQRVMTDNHPTYRGTQWRDRCRLLGMRHLRTAPRRPQTNGKVERWIRTMLDEVLRHRVFPSPEARAVAVLKFVPEYNCHRPHTALGGATPLQRLLKSVTQV